jgi:hypothetical protein
MDEEGLSASSLLSIISLFVLKGSRKGNRNRGWVDSRRKLSRELSKPKGKG